MRLNIFFKSGRDKYNIIHFPQKSILEERAISPLSLQVSTQNDVKRDIPLHLNISLRSSASELLSQRDIKYDIVGDSKVIANDVISTQNKADAILA